MEKRTWVCSDLHGNKKIFDAIMNKIGAEDTVIFLGDAIDRGPDGWAILKEMLNDKRFIVLKGNHEDMMIKAAKTGYGFNSKFNLWFRNGGSVTWEACHGEIENWIERIDSLPIIHRHTNANGDKLLFSHSGYGPWNFEAGLEDDDTWIIEDVLWDRAHFNDEWIGGKDEIVIHGHTPTVCLIDELVPRDTICELEPGALWYCGGHKCCVDCGTAFTGCATLMNIDTFEEEIFCEGE